MKLLFPVAITSVYGLIIRLIFGMFGDIMGIMTASFFVVGPFVIGFLTVFLIPRRKKIMSNTSAFLLPWLTCLILLVITIALNVEGVICWVMAYPLFAIVAGFGGMIANTIRRKKQIEIDDIENYRKWTDEEKLSISVIMLLPFFCALIEAENLTSRQDITVTKTILVNATPEKVWQSIANTANLKFAKKRLSIASLIGFPDYISTTQDSFALGGKRKIFYERGLYFDEKISSFRANESLVFDIRTDPDHIPPTVMDEHILIGGKHLDILRDTYKINPANGGQCQLSISSSFYINTPFNWYASIWARLLMKDILSGTLQRVKAKAEER